MEAKHRKLTCILYRGPLEKGLQWHWSGAARGGAGGGVQAKKRQRGLGKGGGGAGPRAGAKRRLGGVENRKLTCVLYRGASRGRTAMALVCG